METRDALEALEEACLKKEPGDADWFLRPMKEDIDDKLPGLRSLSKREPRSEASSPNVERVGESVWRGVGARIFDSKKG